MALYDLSSVTGRQLVEAAAELLVAGIDEEAVTELASKVVTPLTSPLEVDALVAAAREELDMPELDRARTLTRAAQGQLRRWRDGLLTDREIADRSHQTIGHEGNADLQDLVVLDGLFDQLEWIDATPESIHADRQVIATTYLAHPEPWAGD